MTSDFASEVAKYPQNPKTPKYPIMGSQLSSKIDAKYRHINRKLGSPSKNMSSYRFCVKSTPKSSPKPENTPKWGSQKQCEIRVKFHCLDRKLGSPSKNMTSDFLQFVITYCDQSFPSPWHCLSTALSLSGATLLSTLKGVPLSTTWDAGARRSAPAVCQSLTSADPTYAQYAQ